MTVKKIPWKYDLAFKGNNNYYKVHRSKLAQVLGYEWQVEIISPPCFHKQKLCHTRCQL